MRRIERDLLPVCERYGMGAIVWSPLNSGWLSGVHRRSDGDPGTSTRRARMWPALFDPADPGNVRKYELLEELERIAADLGISLAHLALAWTLEHPAVTSAIIGPRTMQHLEGLLGADEHRLPLEVLDRIDQLVPPGTNVRAEDGAFDPPWRAAASRRRRARR